MILRIIITLLTLALSGLAWSAKEKSPQTATDPSAATSTKKASAAPASEAEKLYQRYVRLHGKMVLAIACVQNPKCIEPEDEVYKYSSALVRITDRLDDLVKQKDLDASYYRGLIAYERGRYYVGRAMLITDPDFILSATVFRRHSLDQFRIAEKNLTINAALKNPDACKYLGDIADQGYLGLKNKDKATDYYYCAAMAYLDQGKKNAAADMYNAMKNTALHNDPRTIEIYARLHNDPVATNWRKSSSQTTQVDLEQSKINRQ